ncbi:MAG TPA: helix-turn-helix transcriptional regulator [Jatrophihabitantaceae bacterium]|nr:helix-turn-helix transcriptional regulator [Jatrophihabitantaceae bacterium]
MTQESTALIDRPGPRREELRSFLRSRRALLRPEEVGMAPGSRRRTPGLRREEVALLAGVGVTWYTWLEQGRRINASQQVLDAIARTLKLDAAERWHLYRLAEATPVRPPTELVVPDSVREVLRSLEPTPALLVNARYDVIESNSGHRDLFFSWHSMPCIHKNLLWCAMTEPNNRARFLNYDEEMPYLVARLRAGFGAHLDDPEWAEDIRRLSDLCPEFVELWARHDVAEPQVRLRIFEHAEVGVLRLHATEFEIPAAPGVRLITYTPVGADDRERLAKLPHHEEGPDWRAS